MWVCIGALHRHYARITAMSRYTQFSVTCRQAAGIRHWFEIIAYMGKYVHLYRTQFTIVYIMCHIIIFIILITIIMIIISFTFTYLRRPTWTFFFTHIFLHLFYLRTRCVHFFCFLFFLFRVSALFCRRRSRCSLKICICGHAMDLINVRVDDVCLLNIMYMCDVHTIQYNVVQYIARPNNRIRVESHMRTGVIAAAACSGEWVPWR